MKLRLSAPGKTFLLGEYAVLSGEPALLAATGPRFVTEFELGQSGSCEGIHPASPAGQWIRQNSGLFQNLALRFLDPHSEQGGLGASSAQFLAACVWSQLAEKPMTEWSAGVSPQGVWQNFRSVAWDGSGLPPSGADVMAQWMGGLTQFQSQPFSLQSLRWPFENLSFTLLRTSKKVPTHRHLGTLSGTPFSDLTPSLDRGIAAFHQGVESSFLQAVNEYGQALAQMELLHDQVRPLLKGLFEIPQVMAAKGCGALGADILVAFHRPIHKKAVVEQAQRLGLHSAGGVEDLEQGLRLEMDIASLPLSSPRYQTPSFSLNEGDLL